MAVLQGELSYPKVAEQVRAAHPKMSPPETPASSGVAQIPVAVAPTVVDADFLKAPMCVSKPGRFRWISGSGEGGRWTT